MLKANRPYSCINVFDNLHKKIPKRESCVIPDEGKKESGFLMMRCVSNLSLNATRATLPFGEPNIAGFLGSLEAWHGRDGFRSCSLAPG